MRLPDWARAYADEAAALAGAPSTREESYYPALHTLLVAVLASRGLPLTVRASTSEAREAGRSDLPDLALYDGDGDIPVVLCEVKLPDQDARTVALSTDRNDQVGRYLARTGVVLVSTVREFVLVVGVPPGGGGPVPPEERQIEHHALLWASATDLAAGVPPSESGIVALADLVEVAVTGHATIAEPESLARVLARIARGAKGALPARFTEAVAGLLDDFGEALGLSFEGEDGEEFLRSSLVQTAFYGLFAGWTLWARSGRQGEFRWQECGEYLRIPFLAGLFHEFHSPTRLKELGLRPWLDRAAAALGRVDAERFLSRFAPHLGEEGATPETRAILYFYEPFLEAFDPELRKRLGVWYTPEEIVRYQVLRVHELLRTELDCPQGLADRRVVILDPCCGTGAYLVEAMRVIAEELGRGDALTPARLLEAVCSRVIGFEILTAPFVIAHLQIHLILSDLGVEPDDAHRPAIYLTNALTGWERGEQLKLRFPDLQSEHDAARRVKTEERIIVVIGNPPYDRWAGAPVREEAALADHYKGIRRDSEGKQIGKSELWRRFGVRKHLLDDLYLRFFRLAERRVGEQAPFGIVSLISNSSYLIGRSHPLMRESLLHSFHEVWIDNLHGNRIASERTPWGDSCETAFSTRMGPGIKVGTSVTTLLKRPSGTSGRSAAVHVRDFWGRAPAKRRALLESVGMQRWSRAARARAAELPEGPRGYERHRPTAAARWSFVAAKAVGGFEAWPGLDELFPASHQGVNPNRGMDGSLLDTSRRTLEQRMRDYYSDLSFEELAERHPVLCTPRARYEPRATREDLLSRSAFSASRVVPYLVFPLDRRWLYYETVDKLLNERRPELWRDLPGNRFLLTVPYARRASEALPIRTQHLFDLHAHDRGTVGFPARVRAEEPNGGDAVESPYAVPRANLAPAAWVTLRDRLGLSGDLDGPSAIQLVQDLFDLVLAVCHAPRYQEDHASCLAQDWAHIPIPRDPALLREGADLGARISVLLDPEADPTPLLRASLGEARQCLGAFRHESGRALREADLTIIHSYYGAAAGRWEERDLADHEPPLPGGDGQTGDLWLSKSVYVANVPRSVWRYELGGYPVLKKWLGYRQASRREGRPLTLEEAGHVTSIVQRIAALLALGPELDAFYEKAAADALTVDELGLA